MRKYFILLFCVPFVLGYTKSEIFFGPKATYLKLDIKPEANVVFSGGDQNIHLEGALGGLEVGYRYLENRGLYAYLAGSYLQGEISNSPNPSRDIINAQAEARFGFNYVGLQGLCLRVTPYIGLGFLYNYQDRSSFGPNSSILYEYFSIYLPVGFFIDYKFYPWLYGGAHFQWRPDLDPTLKVETFSNERWILHRENTQLLAELMLDFLLGDCKEWKISVVPYWEKLRSGSTLDKATLSLPEQTSIYWGAKLLIGYRF